jgi:hypothetical protein
LEKEFDPTYLLNDLVNLTKFNIYLKLMINGISSKPFSATTLAPISEPTGNVEKVIRVSRERYGTPHLTVEEKISKWLGAEFHSEAARVESAAVDQEDMQENMRFNHRVTSGPAATIRATAPLAPRVDRTTRVEAPTPPPAQAPRAAAPAPKPVPPVAPQPKPAAPMMPPPPAKPPVVNIPSPQRKVEAIPEKRSEPKAEPKTERLQIERRQRQTENHPHRRSTDKKPERIEKPKPKTENPVWDTVSKLSQDKLKNKVQKTTAALESLSKSLEQSLKNDFAASPSAPKADPPAVKPIQPVKPEFEISKVMHTMPEAKPAQLSEPVKPFRQPEPVEVPKTEKYWEPIDEPIPHSIDEVELDFGDESDKDPNPPGSHVQSHLTMIEQREHPAVAEALKKVPKVNLKPGDKVKF